MITEDDRLCLRLETNRCMCMCNMFLGCVGVQCGAWRCLTDMEKYGLGVVKDMDTRLGLS